MVQEQLDRCLPPEVDRSLALATYDATQAEEQGGPTLAGVIEDLTTLPFLADRRVVLIRDADTFITAHREALERYAGKPAATGVLILACRSFPKTTKLYKAIEPIGLVVECKGLRGRSLIEFALETARTHQKRMDSATAEALVALIGEDTGVLAAEIEKLATYAAERPAITSDDVASLVGQTREEKIFAVMDAAASGDVTGALRLWQQTLATDPDASYRAVGGVAWVMRQWITAKESGGGRSWRPAPARLSARSIRRALAAVADLDSQAKTGLRSIETGVEMILVRLAKAAH